MSVSQVSADDSIDLKAQFDEQFDVEETDEFTAGTGCCSSSIGACIF